MPAHLFSFQRMALNALEGVDTKSEKKIKQKFFTTFELETRSFSSWMVLQRRWHVNSFRMPTILLSTVGELELFRGSEGFSSDKVTIGATATRWNQPDLQKIWSERCQCVQQRSGNKKRPKIWHEHRRDFLKYRIITNGSRLFDAFRLFSILTFSLTPCLWSKSAALWHFPETSHTSNTLKAL